MSKKLIKSIELGWIVVKDLQKAIDFYVNVLGFELTTHAPEYNWAEVKAPASDFVIGIGAPSENDATMKPGSNMVPTFTTENIEMAITQLKKEGVTFAGDIIEVPGHVKMISMFDVDGNHMQLVQKLY